MKGFPKSKSILFGLVTVGLLASALVAFFLFGPMGTTQAAASTKCSAATMKGTYIFSNDGYLIEDGNKIPFASAGREQYDGKGRMKGIFSESYNGKITRKEGYSGSYNISSDCIMSLTLDNSSSKYSQFVSPDGSQFTFIQADNGAVISGEGKRVAN